MSQKCLDLFPIWGGKGKMNQNEKRYINQYQDIISNAMKVELYPIMVQSAKGCKITDITGTEYIDFNASAAVANIGYRHREFLAKVSTELQRLSANCPIIFPTPPLSRIGQTIN